MLTFLNDARVCLADSCHDVIKATASATGKETCAPDALRYPARCCSDATVSGFRLGTCEGKKLWSAANGVDFHGCQQALTWHEADRLYPGSAQLSFPDRDNTSLRSYLKTPSFGCFLEKDNHYHSLCTMME